VHTIINIKNFNNMNKKNIITIAIALVIIAGILLIINSIRKPSGLPLDQKMKALILEALIQENKSNVPVDLEQSKKTIEQFNNAANKSE